MKSVFKKLRPTRAFLGIFFASFCFSSFAERWTCSALYFWFDKKGEYQSDSVNSGDLKLEEKKTDDGTLYKTASGNLKMPMGYSAPFTLQYMIKGDTPIMYLWAQIRKTTGKSLQLVFRADDSSWITAIEDPDLPKMPLMGRVEVEFNNPVIGQKLLISNPETLKLTAAEFENTYAELAFKAEDFAQNDLAKIIVDCMYMEKDHRPNTLDLNKSSFRARKSFKIPPAL